MSRQKEFVPLNIAILTVSDSRTLETDRSGAYLAEQLQAVGHRLADRQLLADDRYQLRACVSAWIADPAVQAVIITGGTGLTGRDAARNPSSRELMLTAVNRHCRRLSLRAGRRGSPPGDRTGLECRTHPERNPPPRASGPPQASPAS
jgi:hypothetical protein